MRYDVLHDRATMEYQYPGDCFIWRWPDRELHVYVTGNKCNQGFHVIPETFKDYT